MTKLEQKIKIRWVGVPSSNSSSMSVSQQTFETRRLPRLVRKDGSGFLFFIKSIFKINTSEKNRLSITQTLAIKKFAKGGEKNEHARCDQSDIQPISVVGGFAGLRRVSCVPVGDRHAGRRKNL